MPRVQDRTAGETARDALVHSGNLISFDPPGVITTVSTVCGQFCGTQPHDINARGDIVGTYQDVNVVPHGFLRTSQGQFIIIDAPGAGLGAGLNEGTTADAITDAGVVGGYYQDSKHVYHAFIRSKNGSFVTFDAPGAGSTPNAGFSQGTQLFGINSQGASTGEYYDASGQQHGFVRSPGGAVATVDPTGSVFTVIADPNESINDSGDVTGTSAGSDFNFHMFVRHPNGTFTILTAPGAGTGPGIGTFGGGTNQAGTTRGYMVDNGFVAHGVLRAKDGNYTVFDDPNASNLPDVPQFQGTVAFTINASGATAGLYDDVNGQNHGFERFANGTFANFDAPGATGTGGFQGTVPGTNNSNGSVAGFWADQNGLLHGFVWTPHP